MKKKEIFPEKGRSSSSLLEQIPILKEGDAWWELGKVFGFVYYPGNSYARVSEEYYCAYMYENTLNPSTFPSLMDFEKEIVAMAAELMHGDKNVVGNVTTGGTESIFMAMKVAREVAREKSGRQNGFEMVLPETIHPAFLKACDHLSVKAVLVPVGEDKRADPEAIESAINENTILLACSAPCFPYGVVDPIARVAKIAKEHDLLCHVDACMGGFMLPFMEDMGYEIPQFDFRVPGVSSISLDAHKYGYAPKGNSIVLYKDRALRKKQFFVHTEWPGGIFASTTFMGSKSGGPQAGCWAIMKHIGKEGYRKIARDVMTTTKHLMEGINQFETLEIISDPNMSVMAFTSTKGDIFNIGDALEKKGWHLDRLQFPDALHITVTQLNIGKEESFLEDLAEIVKDKARLGKDKKSMSNTVNLAGGLTKILPGALLEKAARKLGGKMSGKGSGKQAALYGISASFSNRKDVKKLVLNLLDGMY